MAGKPKSTPPTGQTEILRGLPVNLEAERFLLGAIILDNAHFVALSETILPEDFSIEKHRRIYARMNDLFGRKEAIDRVALANELMRLGELESCDGLAYLVSLDDGLPRVANVEGYARIVKEKSNLRRLIFASQRTVDLALDAAGSAEEIARGLVDEIAPIQVGQSKDEGRTAEKIVMDFPGGVGAFLDPSLRRKGLPTGFYKLDEMLGGGLQDGELIIIGARPACGKSAIGINICQYISVQRGKRADVFSLEMSGESLITRMLCAVARVDQQNFRSGFVNAFERDKLLTAMNKIVDSQLRIHDDFKKSLRALESRTRKAVREGSRLVVLDYLQLMVAGHKTENRNLEISEIGRTLKMLAMELQIPVVALSQIGRSAERRGGDMRPQLMDLKESGSIEEHADTVLLLHRPELYKKDRPDLMGIAELDIAKQRNGPTGRINLVFLKEFTKFENNAGDVPEYPPAYQNSLDSDAW